MNREHQLIRQAWVEIDLRALRSNIHAIRKKIGNNVDIMAVVKAEAYGHGAVAIANAAVEAGVSWLGVAIPEEGIQLRNAGIQVPILIFSPLQPDQAESIVRYRLTATIMHQESANSLSIVALREDQVAQAHLKIDTGMGRVGIRPEQTVEFIKKLTSLKGIRISGIYSHMATADENDKTYAKRQIELFQQAVMDLKKAGLLPEKVHLANSAGIMELPEAYFNMVRPGIILYGLYPSNEVNKDQIHLEPVLSLKTRITFVKRVPAGTGISYGQKYHTSKETTIVTIPIGYADGWSRMLSHKAKAIINGKLFPIAGTICMDQCMIDVGDEPVKCGQEVILIGKMGQAEITTDTIAEELGTINYEVTCMLSDRLPRIYTDEK